MIEQKIIDHTIAFAKSKLKDFDGGHDWYHTERVWKMAKTIHQKERSGDLLVIELSSLLHDIADSKFHDGPEDLGGNLAHEFLITQGLDKERAGHVRQIINGISFKSRDTNKAIPTIEFMIVQDADRLDAIGAIGIARAFNYGGFKNRPLHDPENPVQQYDTIEAYKRSDAPTINHFYEKLFLLKNMMNTKTAKEIALERDAFMEAFVSRFLDEWEGRR